MGLALSERRVSYDEELSHLQDVIEKVVHWVELLGESQRLCI